MALGDGIRRNLATVSKEERNLFIDAILQLNNTFYPGVRDQFPAGGVSYWFKQDEIHQSTHVHHCPQFLPWHRDMCNQFEKLLRAIHPELSLHYWDWNMDPTNMPDGDGNVINLFTPDFMGNCDPAINEGSAGAPFLAANFYLLNPSQPDPADGKFRGLDSPVRLNRPDPNNPATWSYPAGGHPFDPPKTLTRGKVPGAPPVGKILQDPFGGDWTPVAVAGPNSVYWPTDGEIINATNWEDFNDKIQGIELGTSINGPHALVHSFLGGADGTLTDPHTSFRDPFVFLFHANIDRLWAMWQRKNAAIRLNPAQVYDTEASTKGSGNVEFGDPNWGILSPMEPWAGFNAQTAATGIIGNVWPIRPWYAPENEQNDPGNNINALDPLIVIPASYDTALHSSYIVTQRDSFSTNDFLTIGSYPAAFDVIYDGFTPNEIGLPGAFPVITFTTAPNSGTVITSMNVDTPPAVVAEDAGALDTPQRITFTFNINFTSKNDFPPSGTDVRDLYVNAVLTGEVAIAPIRLTNQPDPYMIDVDSVLKNPGWLSTDIRVFQLKPGGNIAGSTTTLDATVNSSSPYNYIQTLLAECRGNGNAGTSPFESISQNENTSWLELSQTVKVGTADIPVYNFAIAKVRYRATAQPANSVRVFFRTFNTMVSALDYNTATNYRRRGDGIIPLTGVIGSEIASIPYFAQARTSSATQVDDFNAHDIGISGGEAFMYFGCWLDFNQTAAMVEDAGGTPTSIMNQVRGIHQCLVAEIRFQNGATDPIIPGATPGSSDHLAQRNLSIINSDNPGDASTHVVQHTLLVKPSNVTAKRTSFTLAAVDVAAEGEQSYDELVIRWNNLPRDTKATLFFPEWNVDKVLLLASQLRQGPQLLTRVDANTIECAITDICYVPIPGVNVKPFAGLITLQLPTTVKDGQFFRVDVKQHSGYMIERTIQTKTDKKENRQEVTYTLSKRKVLGAFRISIPVKMGEVLLKQEIRNLAVLRYIFQSIPLSDRWHPIFTRYIKQIADKVKGLGVDPDLIKPSPNDPGIPGADKETFGKEKYAEGKICEVIYDCFGDFTGFVLETCSGTEFFESCEKAIGDICWRACRERVSVSVLMDDKKRICKIIIGG